MVGYAVTSITQAAKPTEKSDDMTADYLRYVASMPGPKVAVGMDLDNPPGLGAQFGEVNSTIHQKLGCVGHVTNGCPRDLDEVQALGFHLFGLNPCVSHAYVPPGRFRPARSARRLRDPLRRPDPRRQARRLHHPRRGRRKSRRGLPGSRTHGAPPPRRMPPRRLRPRAIHQAPLRDEDQDPGMTPLGRSGFVAQCHGSLRRVV